MSSEIAICCSIPNCNEPGEFVPGFDHLNKKLGRPIRPEELAEYIFCKRHKHAVEIAAKQRRGETIEFYPYATALKACERFHAQRTEEESRRQANDEASRQARAKRDAEEKAQAEVARQRFEQELTEYLGRLRPGAMADFHGKELHHAVRCSFGTCGHEAAHETVFVPPLPTLNKALGRDVLPEDLPAFTLCFDHKKALEKRNNELNFHKLSSSLGIIERNRKVREAARRDREEVSSFLDNFFDEAINNVIDLDTGAVKCIGRGCNNVIPAEKHTRVCNSCRKDCPGGCGKSIPKWYPHCKECAAEKEAEKIASMRSGSNRPPEYLAKKREKSEKDRELRQKMCGSSQGGGGNKNKNGKKGK